MTGTTLFWVASTPSSLSMVRRTFGQHAFTYTGASMWRSLPASLRESGSQEEFSRAAYYYFKSLA